MKQLTVGQTTMPSSSPVNVLISNCSAKFNDILHLTDGSFPSSLDVVSYSEWFDKRGRFNLWRDSVGAHLSGPDSSDSKLEKYEHLIPMLSGVLGYLHLVLGLVEESFQQGMPKHLSPDETTTGKGKNERVYSVLLDGSQSKERSIASKLRNLQTTVDNIMRCLNGIDFWSSDLEIIAPMVKPGLGTTVRECDLQKIKPEAQLPEGYSSNVPPPLPDNFFSSEPRPGNPPELMQPSLRSQGYFRAYPLTSTSPTFEGEKALSRLSQGYFHLCPEKGTFPASKGERKESDPLVDNFFSSEPRTSSFPDLTRKKADKMTAGRYVLRGVFKHRCGWFYAYCALYTFMVVCFLYRNGWQWF